MKPAAPGGVAPAQGTYPENACQDQGAEKPENDDQDGAAEEVIDDQRAIDPDPQFAKAFACPLVNHRQRVAFVFGEHRVGQGRKPSPGNGPLQMRQRIAEIVHQRGAVDRAVFEKAVDHVIGKIAVNVIGGLDGRRLPGVEDLIDRAIHGLALAIQVRRNLHQAEN